MNSTMLRVTNRIIERMVVDTRAAYLARLTVPKPDDRYRAQLAQVIWLTDSRPARLTTKLS